MSTEKKLIDKFQKEPVPKEVNLDELLRYLKIFGFEVVSKRGKGSHFIVKNYQYNLEYTIPSKNGKTVSFVYLRELNKLIKRMEDEK